MKDKRKIAHKSPGFFISVLLNPELLGSSIFYNGSYFLSESYLKSNGFSFKGDA